MKQALQLLVFSIAVAALAVSCARITGQTAGSNIDDATIVTEINTAIVQEPDAHFWKIDVTSTDGDVVLNGYIDSETAEDRLIAKTKQLKGVKSVKSLLRIESR